jgi:hypothetical protein
MIEELVTRTGASAWAVGSMLFFLAAWAAVAVWVARSRDEDMDARARIPLDSDGEGK